MEQVTEQGVQGSQLDQPPISVGEKRGDRREVGPSFRGPCFLVCPTSSATHNPPPLPSRWSCCFSPHHRPSALLRTVRGICHTWNQITSLLCPPAPSKGQCPHHGPQGWGEGGGGLSLDLASHSSPPAPPASSSALCKRQVARSYPLGPCPDSEFPGPAN